MDLPHFVYVKLVVVGEVKRRSYVMVETKHLWSVGHLAKYVYDETFKNRGLVSSEMEFYVVEAEDKANPTEKAELTALSSTSPLPIGLVPMSLKQESYLLAVVDSLLPAQGKHTHSPALSAPPSLPPLRSILE